MEPAGYQREHAAAKADEAMAKLPQWSPPVISGSTRRERRHSRRRRRAAMEPAGYQREHGS